MRRFQFRLETVLRLREHELDLCRLDLRRAQAELRRAREHMASARRSAEKSAEMLFERSGAGLSPAEWQAVQHGTEALFGEVRRAERAVRESETRVVAARSRAVEARTRVRALESLRERALAAHELEGRRLEQAELDEVGARVARRGELS